MSASTADAGVPDGDDATGPFGDGATISRTDAQAWSRTVTNHVYIVDRDDIAAAAIAAQLRIRGYATRRFVAASDLLDVLGTLAPGCVIVDLVLPDMSCIELQRELALRGCGFPVVVLTGDTNVSVAVRAMKAGAVDVIVKPVGAAELAASVAGALAALAGALASEGAARRARALIALLSPREREVLDGMVRGGSNKTIAQSLGISPRTVEIHRAKAMEKLGCRKLSEIVRLALAAGFDHG